MRRAWAAGLTVLDEARPPPLDRPVRVITQRHVLGDGISEAGLSGDSVAELFAGFAAAEVVPVEDLLRPDGWPDPADGRFTNAILTDEGFQALAAAAPGHVAHVR